jgi:hypothetical protein
VARVALRVGDNYGFGLITDEGAAELGLELSTRVKATDVMLLTAEGAD